jgi:hypothetical protein
MIVTCRKSSWAEHDRIAPPNAVVAPTGDVWRRVPHEASNHDDEELLDPFPFEMSR